MTTVTERELAAKDPADWKADANRIRRAAKRRSPRSVWGGKIPAEDALQWGLIRAGLDPERRKTVRRLGRLIDQNVDGDTPTGGRGARQFSSEAERVLEVLEEGEPNVTDAAYLVTWGYAAPELASVLDSAQWHRLVLGLSEFAREAVAASHPIVRKLLAGELPAVLGWRLEGLPKRIKLGGLKSHARRGAKLLAGLVTDYETLRSDGLGELGSAATLSCAVALRGAGLAEKIQEQRFRAKELDGLWLLAGRALGLQRVDGSPVFSSHPIKASELKADESLWPALATRVRDGKSILTTAELVRSKPSKKMQSLAETVDLPDTGFADDDTGLAVLRPAWHHRLGRTAVSYRGDHVRLELGSGKNELLVGQWDCHIIVDDHDVRPDGDIEQSCWYSDDDVHYLELEQQWTDGVTLQRQVLVAGDDQWTLLADAVIAPVDKEIRYEARLPLANAIKATAEAETREWLLADSKVRAVVMPIAFPEWRTQRATGKLELEETPVQSALRLQTAGVRRLYAPLFIDWGRRRWKAPRTWRQLTVAEDLEICDASRAHAFRIQIGPQQWVLYRSLRFGRRTFLGLNTISDFYGGRFDPDDGTLDEMITVEEDSE